MSCAALSSVTAISSNIIADSPSAYRNSSCGYCHNRSGSQSIYQSSTRNTFIFHLSQDMSLGTATLLLHVQVHLKLCSPMLLNRCPLSRCRCSPMFTLIIRFPLLCIVHVTQSCILPSPYGPWLAPLRYTPLQAEPEDFVLSPLLVPA